VGDVFNVRSTAANAATMINGNGGDDTINISSDAPTNNGNLDGIAGTLTVDAGSGANTLVISDFGQTSTPNSNAVLTSNQLTGFAGPTNATVIQFAATGGTLALTLRGSDALPDTITVQSTAANVTTTINSGGGDDTLNVQATGGTTTINAGAGNDTINVGSAPPPTVARIRAA